LLAFAAAISAATASEAAPGAVFYQAHRGGLLEVPENTPAAMHHAWACPGAVPEVDVRTTKDGVLVCLHDDTLGRTLDVPEAYEEVEVTAVPFEQLRQWDAGVKFDARYAGERVPSLDEVLGIMSEDAQRQIYLDIKDADLERLAALVEQHGVVERVIFVHGKQNACIALKKRFPGARTMTWISGMPPLMKRQFARMAEGGFEGIDQIQFHLKTKLPLGPIEYVFDEDYLRQAFETAKSAGAELQLRPFRFDAASLRPLLDIGVRWFVADEPRRFSEAVAQAMKQDRAAAPDEE